VLGRAAEEARRLDHGWVGTEHYLLALLGEPPVATETLAELGITYDRVLDKLRNDLSDPDWPPSRYERGKGLSPSAATYKLQARAEGSPSPGDLGARSPSTGCSPRSTTTMGWLDGSTISARRGRRSWTRFGVAQSASPRRTHPSTGPGRAVDVSRSRRPR
jgi:hypothetical protein